MNFWWRILGKFIINAVIFLLIYSLFKNIDSALIMTILVFYIHKVEQDLLFKNTKIKELIDDICTRLKYKVDIKDKRFTSIDID